eukprot:CAMPEP_0174364718 /NCGR_PEP_ID=MMETSP0811_2-20130205/74112_1 /TAXON_ID=73025 ORGANISM="Eutreptiella gymnastica-like, Strain CCMP1594" /NCGR_SAMPLE_ID=MMETSP0811_2 /ASSEMBLY_ACC=CAM_ASM_000667 /LENGTH=50 /DNA_ID=CAMNT_0015504637 /DNA_START=47 /DNA_END=199 /DNA_ORIENTATION=+
MSHKSATIPDPSVASLRQATARRRKGGIRIGSGQVHLMSGKRLQETCRRA